MKIVACEVDVGKIVAASRFTVHVSGARRLAIRTRLGLALFRVAAAVVGAQIDITFATIRRHSLRSTVDEGLPRRMSVADADFRHGVIGAVYLDGVHQADAVGYDADAGTVTRARRHPNGTLVVNGDHVLEETVEGVVTVRRAR